MLRFFTVSRLALNANLIFEIGSIYHILTAFPNWKFYIAYEILKVSANLIEKLSSIELNPHFSRARAVQEQGISVRRRSILYFED